MCNTTGWVAAAHVSDRDALTGSAGQMLLSTDWHRSVTTFLPRCPSFVGSGSWLSVLICTKI